MRRSSRRVIPIGVISAVAVVATSAVVQAQVASWTVPVSGFYEVASNWTPNGLPTPADVVRFDKPGEYDIGFQSSPGVGGLLVSNAADIDFIVAGADTTNRVFRINGDGVVEDAQLRLLGNDAGPRMSLVLTNNLDLRGGTGALEILENAAILNRSTLIDLSGVVPVSGAKASWNMSEDLTVRGAALLNVVEGGLVSNLGDAVLGGTGTADSSNGFLTVTGVGADGQSSTMITGDDMFLGNFGRGQLLVTDGGFVDVGDRLQVAIGAQSDGDISVRGVNAVGNRSTLNTGLLTMGSGGEANLVIREGGLVRSDSATVGDFSSATVEIIGDNEPSAWEVVGSLRLGGTVSGRIEVEDGGRLTANRTFLGLGTATSFLLVKGRDADATTTVWENQEDVYVGGNETTPFGPALIRVDGDARADIGGVVRIWDGGTVRIADGGRFAADTIDHTHGGDFQLLNGGVLHVDRFEGDLVNPAGILAPGVDDTAGATIVLGDYTQQDEAVLSIDIGGTSPGGTHDFVNISGDGDLDGLLEIAVIDGFTPNATDEFTALAADSLIGFFDNVASGQRLDTTDGRGSFVVSYGIGSAFDESRIVLSDFVANATVPGDFDFDGDVDGRDFLEWQRTDRSASGLAAWQSSYGSASSPLSKAATSVPEPNSLMLLCAAVLAVVHSTRKQILEDRS